MGILLATVMTVTVLPGMTTGRNGTGETTDGIETGLETTAVVRNMMMIGDEIMIDGETMIDLVDGTKIVPKEEEIVSAVAVAGKKNVWTNVLLRLKVSSSYPKGSVRLLGGMFMLQGTNNTQRCKPNKPVMLKDDALRT